MAIGLDLQACVKHPAVACSGFGVLVIVVFALEASKANTEFSEYQGY